MPIGARRTELDGDIRVAYSVPDRQWHPSDRDGLA